MYFKKANRKENADRTQDALRVVERVLDQYAAFPSQESRDAVILWTLGQWVFRQFDAFPRLNIFSTEPGSGKSHVMNLVAKMAPKSVDLINARPSFIIDALELNDHVTLTIDETDNLFGRGGNSNRAQYLLAVLNKGFEAEGTAMHGGGGNKRETSVYSPLIAAGMGALPGALQSRSIRIKMRKPTRDQLSQLREFRASRAKHELGAVRDELEDWATQCARYLNPAFQDISMPVKNRDADKWEALFSIAEMAGGEWPLRVNRACRVLEAGDNETGGEEVSLSTAMVRDIQVILDSVMEDAEELFLSELSYHLQNLDWDESYSTPRIISKVLDDYGLIPATIRRGEEVGKGYKRDALEAVIDMA